MATGREESEEDGPSWNFFFCKSERAHRADPNSTAESISFATKELACAGTRLQNCCTHSQRPRSAEAGE